LLVVLCFLLADVSLAESRDEVRGLWVIRTSLRTPEAIDNLVAEAAESGINTLMVQVRGRGDAFYSSRLEPRSDLLKDQPPDFDPLAYVLVKARSRNIRVHAWINTLLVHEPSTETLPRGHVLTRHPEWAMVPAKLAPLLYANKASFPRSLNRIAEVIRQRSDETEGYYLDPAEPRVREFLVQVCSDILSKYAVDGLHLDYIRYPNPEFGFGRAAIDSFKTDIDQKLRAAERKRMSKAFAKNPLAYTQKYSAEWDAFRRRQVTRLVQRLGITAKKLRPGVTVTAAVAADSDRAYARKFQDWKLWMEEGFLDALCPMAYTSDPSVFKNQLAIARGFSFGGKVWAGIGAWQAPIDSTLEKIALARKIRADGFLLFCYGALSEDKPGPAVSALARLKAFLAESEAAHQPAAARTAF